MFGFTAFKKTAALQKTQASLQKFPIFGPPPPPTGVPYKPQISWQPPHAQNNSTILGGFKKLSNQQKVGFAKVLNALKKTPGPAKKKMEASVFDNLKTFATDVSGLLSSVAGVGQALAPVINGGAVAAGHVAPQQAPGGSVGAAPSGTTGATPQGANALAHRLNSILNDTSLSMEDKFALFLFAIMDDFDQQTENKLKEIKQNHGQSVNSGNSAGGGEAGAPDANGKSLDVQIEEQNVLMKKRMQFFGLITKTIDAMSKSTDQILQSFGR